MEFPLKTAQQIIDEGKAHLVKMKKEQPNSYKNTQEDSFLVGWLQAHYEALYNYSKAMHEEKQD